MANVLDIVGLFEDRMSPYRGRSFKLLLTLPIIQSGQRKDLQQLINARKNDPLPEEVAAQCMLYRDIHRGGHEDMGVSTEWYQDEVDLIKAALKY